MGWTIEAVKENVDDLAVSSVTTINNERLAAIASERVFIDGVGVSHDETTAVTFLTEEVIQAVKLESRSVTIELVGNTSLLRSNSRSFTRSTLSETSSARSLS